MPRVLSSARVPVLATVLITLPSTWSGCAPPPYPPKESPAAARPAPSVAPASAAELVIEDVTVGTGRPAKKGDAVSVHYVGTLDDGSIFDTSRERGQPFSFILGQGKVIAGWEQGVVGMREGGRRRLVVPSHLGYGEGGSPPKIPGGATLHFDIELLQVVE
jgi:FKBP-type peptidyl-prolyl cis-trans isomerase